MKLNQPITRKKAAFPTKQTMNLYYKPDRTTKPATVALYVLFFLVVLLGLSKVLIYDVLAELGDKKEQLAEYQRQLTEYEEQLADYDRIKLEYERFSATPEESVTDRAQLLTLVDTAVRSQARVDSLSVNGEQMLLQFSNVTLKQTADVVQALEASDLVASTQVNTAATEEGRGVVRASILVQLKEEAEADGAGTGGTEGTGTAAAENSGAEGVGAAAAEGGDQQ